MKVNGKITKPMGMGRIHMLKLKGITNKENMSVNGLMIYNTVMVRRLCQIFPYMKGNTHTV